MILHQSREQKVSSSSRYNECVYIHASSETQPHNLVDDAVEECVCISGTLLFLHFFPPHGITHHKTLSSDVLIVATSAQTAEKEWCLTMRHELTQVSPNGRWPRHCRTINSHEEHIQSPLSSTHPLWSIWQGWSGKIFSACTHAHSNNQYQYPTDFQNNCSHKHWPLVNTLTFQPHVSGLTLRQSLRGKTQPYRVILSLHKWHIETKAQFCSKHLVRTERKNVKTWLGLGI